MAQYLFRGRTKREQLCHMRLLVAVRTVTALECWRAPVQPTQVLLLASTSSSDGRMKPDGLMV